MIDRLLRVWRALMGRATCTRCALPATRTDTDRPAWRRLVAWVVDLPLCVRLFALVYIVMLLSACGQIAPPQTPAQLDHTPGPPVTVTEHRVTTTAFTVTYPPGWEAISAAAFQQPGVIFVSPDEAAVIGVAVDPRDISTLEPPAPSDGLLRYDTLTVDLPDGTTVTALLSAPDARWLDFAPLFADLVESIHPPDAT
ncbi:MAG: hypothetical protein ACOCZH_02060 [Phototrophicaceae bacterium]